MATFLKSYFPVKPALLEKDVPDLVGRVSLRAPGPDADSADIFISRFSSSLEEQVA
jgi:hypothetical protein